LFKKFDKVAGSNVAWARIMKSYYYGSVQQ